MYRQSPPYQPSFSTTPIAPHHPLRWPPAIIDRIAQVFADSSGVYLVGGAVRDALRGQPISDLDLVTAGNGLRLARQIADSLNGAYYPVDKERGTGRALVDTIDGPLTVDVASFRGPDLLSDLQGRDFTINAIASPLSEPDTVIDPLDGQGDLLIRRLLRQCSESSILSDPVRALRAVRSSLKFRLHMTPETTGAVKEAGTLLGGSDGLHQPERVRDELFKLLGQTNPGSALRLLEALGLRDVLLPFPKQDAETLAETLRHVVRFSQLVTIVSPQRDDNTASDVILGLAVMVLDRWRGQLQEHLAQKLSRDRPYLVLAFLAALTPPGQEDIGQMWEDHFRLSNGEAHTIARLIESQSIFPSEPPVDARIIHRYYRSVGETGVTGVLLWLAHFLAESPATGQVDPATWGTLLDEVATPLLDAFFWHHQQVISPPPLLTGTDLMRELSLTPGPTIGHLLSELLEAQAAGEIQTRDDALVRARFILTRK